MADTKVATDPAGVDTGAGTDGSSGSDQGQPPADASGAQGGQAADPAVLKQENGVLRQQLTDSQAETEKAKSDANRIADTRVSNALLTQERKASAKTVSARIATLQAEADEGDATTAAAAVAELAQMAGKPGEDADAEAAATAARAEGAYQVINARVIALNPPEDVNRTWHALWIARDLAGLNEAMDTFAIEKAGGPGAAGEDAGGKKKDPTPAELKKENEDLKKRLGISDEQDKINNARGGAGADLSGGGGGGGTGYKTKAEARVLHIAKKITNAQMRVINDDPTIPES